MTCVLDQSKGQCSCSQLANTTGTGSSSQILILVPKVPWQIEVDISKQTKPKLHRPVQIFLTESKPNFMQVIATRLLDYQCEFEMILTKNQSLMSITFYVMILIQLIQDAIEHNVRVIIQEASHQEYKN